MSGTANGQQDDDDLFTVVRAATPIIFAGIAAYIFWRFESPIEPGTLIGIPIIFSGLLAPFLLARKGRRGINRSLLAALVFMTFGTVAIAEHTLTGRGSTAALTLLLAIPFQWLTVGVCFMVGRESEADLGT